MTGSKEDLIKYRINRAWDTLDDARILADKGKWNSTINEPTPKSRSGGFKFFHYLVVDKFVHK